MELSPDSQDFALLTEDLSLLFNSSFAEAINNAKYMKHKQITTLRCLDTILSKIAKIAFTTEVEVKHLNVVIFPLTCLYYTDVFFLLLSHLYQVATIH